MANHDVVFEKLAEALQAEPEVFRLSRSTPHTDAVEEIEEIRRLAEVLEEPEPSSYTST